MSSGSTLNLTTGRSRASHFESKRLETGFLLDSDRLWRVFLATFGISPVLAAPIPRCQLAWWLAVTPMPSSEATPAVWIALLDGHLWVAVTDGLALATLARAYTKFLRFSWRSNWPITGQLFHYAFTTVRPLNLTLFFIATDKFPPALQSPNVSSKKSFCEL